MLNLVRPSYFYGAVFGFYALVLLIPSSYGIFAASLMALSLVGAITTRNWQFTSQDIAFAILLAVFPLSLIPSLIFKQGDWGYFDYPLRALLFVPLIFGLRKFTSSARFECFLVYGAATGGLGAAIFSFISFLVFPGIDGVGKPLTNSIAFGQIAAILAIISLAGFLKFSAHFLKYYFIVGFLGAIFAVVASGSAGALLGLVAGIGVELLAGARLLGSGGLGRKNVLACLMVIAFLMLVPLMISEFGLISADVSATLVGNGMGTSQGQRLILWGIAIKTFALHPLLGIGPGHAHLAIAKYCETHFCTNDFAVFTGVHNQYLDVLMSAGLIGLGGWLIFSCGVLRLFWNRSLIEGDGKQASVAGFSVVLSMMVSALSQGLYHHNISVLVFFFSITFLWFVASSRVDAQELEAPGTLSKFA